MINLNANVTSLPQINFNETITPNKIGPEKSGFADAMKAVGKYISKVDDIQQASDASIQDLLTGKNEDINSVVAAVAKADVSFKLLVGVRNKLIEAYKQTMNMQI
jgi:flagellar hook-basal body complex protein FliE